jgi:tetratricopeptide (TPR) repeat protein
MRHSIRFVSWPLLALLSLPVAAQTDTQNLATAVVAAMAPAVDDPDAVVKGLLTTALQHRRSPAANFLVDEAIRLVGALQQPAAMREFLAKTTGTERMHGLLSRRLSELAYYLDRAVDGGVATGRDQGPFTGQASQFLVVGPFGDVGDHFVGVTYAPELQFPALGSELPGRAVTAKVRTLVRPPNYRTMGLANPARDLDGVYYALHRVEVATAMSTFLEVECGGEYQVFVDGAEVLRVQPWLQPGPQRRYIALQLPAGPHETLVKTCTADRHAVALRWVDAEGATIAAITEVGAEVPLQPILARATRETTPFVTALDVFARAANAAGATATVRIAALRCAESYDANLQALAIAETLQQESATDPTDMLALAEATRALDLPDEMRAAAARTLEEKAIAELPPEHHHARFAQARLLEQQDRREDAMRLLTRHPAAGPMTWSYRYALAQRLHFGAEETPLLREWSKACPRDPRPLAALAGQARSAGDAHGALALLLQADDLRKDQLGALNQAFDLALDLGELAAATPWIERLAPDTGDPAADLGRLKLQLRVAERDGNSARYAEILRAIATHPYADTATLERAATRCSERGQPEQAIACLNASLALDPDQPHVRSWLHALSQPADAMPVEGAAFAAFRRDGDAARTAFQPTEREQTATSTVLIDQRIVEFQPDGSWLAEVHELRRINDLAGVEEFRTASAPASADEVLLLHTIPNDGRSYVPPKVQHDYTLQRLEPGAFLEWRYREHGSAPGPSALRTERFYFQSADAPIVLSELVLIRPAQSRGELRGHDLGTPTRKETLPDGREVLVFTRENAPRLAQERLSAGLGAMAPFAEVGEDQPPFALLRETRVQLMQRTHATPAVQALAETLFAGLTDDRQKLAAAWSWSQRQIETGPVESANSAILRKKGSRFLVAMALIRAAGLDVAPTACRSERADLGDGDDVEFTDSDTHTLPGAMVTLGNGERVHLFLDAPRHWPLGTIPAARANTNAFVVRDGGFEIVPLPASQDAVQQVRAHGTATITGNSAHLEATIEVGDVQGFALAERIRELKEDVRKLAARQIAQQILTGWRVQSAQVVTEALGEPFRLTATAERSYVQQNGDRFLAPLPMPPGKLLASLGDRSERTMPARLAVDLLTDWDIELDPGEDLVLAEVPQPTFLQQDSLLYRLTMERNGDKLRIRNTVRVQPTTLPTERFVDWLRALTLVDRANQTSLQFTARAK